MMDREQFTSAVLAAEPTLYRVAKTMLRSEHDCADAAQQAILRAWEQLDSLQPCGISKHGWSAYSSTSAARYCAVSSGLRRMTRLLQRRYRRLRLMITATCMPPSPHWRKSCACRWSCTT